MSYQDWLEQPYRAMDPHSSWCKCAECIEEDPDAHYDAMRDNDLQQAIDAAEELALEAKEQARREKAEA